MLNLPFLEKSSPPPFYQPQLSQEARRELDGWFIGEQAQAYYLRHFAAIDKAGRLIPSWHWSALIMTFAWLLYRKRFLDCLVYCIAGWSFIKLNIVILLSLAQFVLIRHLPENQQIMAHIVLAFGVWLFWAAMVARWSNAYYYRMARREIADVLVLYPSDKAAQKAHLQQEGGVSLVGMALACLIFFCFSAVIAWQFVPMIAKQQEQTLIYDSYQLVYQAHKRIEAIYQKQGCPVGLPIASERQQDMQVVGEVAGVQTDCAVVLTVNKARYPVRYLNGQTLVLYRMATGDWRCQTSLNKTRTPKRCIG